MVVDIINVSREDAVELLRRYGTDVKALEKRNGSAPKECAGPRRC